MKKTKVKMAWVVTWERGVEDLDKFTDAENFAAVLNPALSGGDVCRLVELIYVTKYYSLSQRMDWALARKSHLSQFGSVNGAKWDGQIFCGHTAPRLYARKVDDFSIERDANGLERPHWTENYTLNIQRAHAAL